VRRRGRVGRSILRRVMTSTREGSSADAIGAVEPSPRGARVRSGHGSVLFRGHGRPAEE
jgi:hypothetical protein